MTSKPVYSTRDGAKNRRDDKAPKKARYQPGEGPTKMRLERKGRGGKEVTILHNLPFSEDEAKDLKKDLAARLGTGATFKNSTIEVRGDVRDRIESFFQEKGWKIVRAGG